MKIGVLKEGFDHTGLAPSVNNIVRKAIAKLEALGAVSVPT